ANCPLVYTLIAVVSKIVGYLVQVTGAIQLRASVHAVQHLSGYSVVQRYLVLLACYYYCVCCAHVEPLSAPARDRRLCDFLASAVPQRVVGQGQRGRGSAGLVVQTKPFGPKASQEKRIHLASISPAYVPIK